MACKECDERVSSRDSEIDTVRDIERMRAVVDRLVLEQAQTGWKADYAYRNVHRHASTWDVLLWTGVLALVGYAAWLLLFPRSDGEADV